MADCNCPASISGEWNISDEFEPEGVDVNGTSGRLSDGVCDKGEDCPPQGQMKKNCKFNYTLDYQSTTGPATQKLFEREHGSSDTWQLVLSSNVYHNESPQSSIVGAPCGMERKIEVDKDSVLLYTCTYECDDCTGS